MTVPVNKQSDTNLHCRLFDSMSREMNVPPKYAHSHIYITLTFFPQQMVQLNWKHNCHENMMPSDVDCMKQVMVMERWQAGNDFCALVIEAATLSHVPQPVCIL